MWRKLMQYAHLHEVNPDKYPASRTPVEFSEFWSDLEELMKSFFDSEGLFSLLIKFFVDNPVLVFLIGVACAYGAFNLLSHAFKVAKM